MKIESAQILMQGQRQYVEEKKEQETLRAWVGDERPDFEGRQKAPAVQSNPAMTGEQGRADPPPFTKAVMPVMSDGGIRWPSGDVRLELSDEARSSLPVRMSTDADEIEAVSPEDRAKILILNSLYAKITGKNMEIVNAGDIVNQNASSNSAGGVDRSSGGLGDGDSDGAARGDGPERAGFGLEYDYYSSHYESEKTTFSAQGVVKTADGKEISFSVDLSMSREYMEENRISIRKGDAVVKDPLVINYSGNAAELTETKYSFDLDADGRSDQISFVTPGSGFLVADLNDDGVVNDGRELFGPSTGNGFAELATHDNDGNGWIDEGDNIYDSLRIWSKDADGQDQLMALGSAGVGAIFLGNLNTDFSHKSSDNQLLGEVVSTGIYLGEEGEVGTVQQINLVV